MGLEKAERENSNFPIIRPIHSFALVKREILPSNELLPACSADEKSRQKILKSETL